MSEHIENSSDAVVLPDPSEVRYFGGGCFWKDAAGKYVTMPAKEYGRLRAEREAAASEAAEGEARDGRSEAELGPEPEGEAREDSGLPVVAGPMNDCAEVSDEDAAADESAAQEADDDAWLTDAEDDDEDEDDNSSHSYAGWAGDLPACKMPVETRTPRHNQWTRPKMAAFLRELAASQSVVHAARAVGMSRQSAYALRNRLSGTPFALGWEMALEAGMQQLAHALMDRAVNGEEVQHYYHGELVGTSRRYDNRLGMWLLQNPWRVGRQQVAREYVSQAFDRMLERIEWESLDWKDGEMLPGRPLQVEEPAPGSEAEQSEDEDIAAEEEEAARDAAFNGYASEPASIDKEHRAEMRRERRYMKAAAEDVDDFLGQRSWYGALAAEESQRRRTPQGRWRGA